LLKPKSKAPFCKCGCGGCVKWSKYHKCWNIYLNGHNKGFTVGSRHTSKSKDKISKAHTGKKFSIERRRNRRGPNSPIWKGGVTYDNRPPELTPEYKQAIRRRDGFTCQLCGYTNRGKKWKLPTHHIDENRHNNHPDNMITICRACHGETKIIADKAAWFMVCTNLVKKSKRLNPERHRAVLKMYRENMKIFY